VEQWPASVQAAMFNELRKIMEGEPAQKGAAHD
jgi:hypothetical protein